NRVPQDSVDAAGGDGRLPLASVRCWRGVLAVTMIRVAVPGSQTVPMSIELICSALGLRPDRWPPDHYTLLGLPPGEVDAVQVEERVLERRERLRPSQLAHPDPVTDAMNRLAQALVCLSDPAAKAAYDATLRPTAAPEAPPTPLRLAPGPPIP